MFKTSKNYIAVIQKDINSDYGVIFPDFLGCITAGATLDEAKNMAEEALQFHVDGIIEDKELLPEPISLDEIKKHYLKAEVYLIISAKIPSKAQRINLTIEEGLLRKFDKYLEIHNETRSGFLAEIIKKEIR